jgi:hypothetical protein
VLGNGSLNCLRVGSVDNIDLLASNEIVEGRNRPNTFTLHKLGSIRGSITDYLLWGGVWERG